MLKPPNTNGIIELTVDEQTEIKAKLDVIVSEFVPSDEQPTADTFYITSTYNMQNVGNEINGDTVQFLLTPTQEG